MSLEELSRQVGVRGFEERRVRKDLVSPRVGTARLIDKNSSGNNGKDHDLSHHRRVQGRTG